MSILSTKALNAVERILFEVEIENPFLPYANEEAKERIKERIDFNYSPEHLEDLILQNTSPIIYKKAIALSLIKRYGLLESIKRLELFAGLMATLMIECKTAKNRNSSIAARLPGEIYCTREFVVEIQNQLATFYEMGVLERIGFMLVKSYGKEDRELIDLINSIYPVSKSEGLILAQRAGGVIPEQLYLNPADSDTENKDYQAYIAKVIINEEEKYQRNIRDEKRQTKIAVYESIQEQVDPDKLDDGIARLSLRLRAMKENHSDDNFSCFTAIAIPILNTLSSELGNYKDKKESKILQKTLPVQGNEQLRLF